MQAAKISGIVTFSFGTLATTASYAQSLTISTTCIFVLAIIVYSALRFLPC
jgi:hypothetical protein